MQLRGHFGSEQLEKTTQELQETLRQIKENAAIRKLRLQDAVDMHLVCNFLLFNIYCPLPDVGNHVCDDNFSGCCPK